MVERIRTLLQARQLTPTQFADAIGVARPIISHILSGRNKPSLEVVQKVINAFPDLSVYWLLNGTGPMVPASGPATHSVASEPAPMPGKPSDAAEAPAKRLKVASSPAEGDLTQASSPPIVVPPAVAPFSDEAAAPAKPSSAPVQSPITPQPQPAVLPPLAVAPATNPVAAFIEPGKKIRRIVIFYQDGTFGDFLPE
jgi:transcriptional regulator with XRE-family HTH domain